MKSSIIKGISFAIMFIFVFTSIGVMAFDDVVSNGDFTNGLTDWDVIESPQFTIDVENEKAKFTGDGISTFWNVGPSLNNGTFYRTDLLERDSFNISGNEINEYVTLSHTTTELITNPTFDDLTPLFSGWYSTEFGYTQYINGDINKALSRYDVNSTNTPVQLRDAYAGIVLNQSAFTSIGGFLDSEISYKHYVYDEGTVQSNMTIDVKHLSEVQNEIYNSSTDYSTSWDKITELTRYVFPDTYINTTLSANHSLKLGETNYTAKQTSWDNCYVNLSTYYTNGSYTSGVIDASENCSWNQVDTYTSFSPIDITERLTLFFRSGDSSTYDSTWSNWVNAGDPEIANYEDNSYKNSYNVTGFGQYSQYKIEWRDSLVFRRPRQFYGASIGGILVSDNTATASLTQSVFKPYTNFTIVEYEQQIILNNILDCNITVSFGNNTLTSYNVTSSNESVENFSFNVSGLVDPMGEYDFNVTVKTTFASPNVTVVRIPMDIVFALDSSGSMGTTDMNNLKTATKNFIGLLNETDRVAIFSYDGGGSEVARPYLQEEYAYMTSANKTLFNSTVDSIVANGFTCFYDTVGEAIDYTQNNKIDGRLEYVIGMTDGASNSDDDWSPEDIWGNITTNDPNNYDSDNLNQSTTGLKGILSAPCIVYTIGLGISHDISYPSAPNWSYVPPNPSTGLEYDIWNVAATSPNITHSEGGKYGTNETGIDNTGKYFYTTDSSDLPSIFESLYGNIYISEVSGINCNCIVNIDNVKVLIPPQAPHNISFYVEYTSPLEFEYYGTFNDNTLNSSYLPQVNGIKSIMIIIGNNKTVDTFYLNVTNITHIGNGVYQFYHMWKFPPFELNATSTLTTKVIVTDTTGLSSTVYGQTVETQAINWLIYVSLLVFATFFIYLIKNSIKDGLENVVKGVKK